MDDKRRRSPCTPNSAKPYMVMKDGSFLEILPRKATMARLLRQRGE